MNAVSSIDDGRLKYKFEARSWKAKVKVGYDDYLEAVAIEKGIFNRIS